MRKSFEVLDVTSLEIPLRSKIILVEAIGRDTLAIESLTSLINRTAMEHSITTGTFIKSQLLPYILNDVEASLTKEVNTYYRLINRSFSINENTLLGRSVINAMHDLTFGNGFYDLTLIGISILLKQSSIRTSRSWCPVCFYEAEELGNPIYEKLIWSLSCVTTCLIHNCYLCTECLHCKTELKYLNTSSRVGYCDNCFRWLGEESTPINSTDINWQHWVQENLDFLLCNQTFINENLDSIRIVEQIGLIFQQLRKSKISKKQLADIMGYNRCTLFEWMRGAHGIALESLLLLSYCVGISVEHLLFSDMSKLVISNVKQAPESVRGGKRDTTIKTTIAARGEFLQKIISRNDYPPPKLGDIAKELGYKSNESLRGFFPVECKIIGERHKEFRAKQSVENNISLRSKVRQEIIECYKEGYYPSKRRLEDRLGQRGLFMNSKFNELRKEVFIEFGIQPR
ncbi:TniQ protein [Paenibacillus taihuensis]|uniref:TniQ protein n=1 Tax=Paenibacillus taihuensis TaxID=1156355 RepID=A0A3D9RNS5_9BACL|nr:TniQ family protein [Paenibacillus taihuensis]REE81560.1 TniQ protein [Paenibacillus taihuensis]